MQSQNREIRVSIPEQRLDLLENGCRIASYPVSTAVRGTGFEEGSLRTPTGRFRICKKIGAGCRPGTVFRGRVPVKGEADFSADGDRVLSRILWLDGLEPANRNTKDRFIYIHGTNHEPDIGRATSHGCVRMRNADVIDLFDRVTEGTEVFILS